MSKRSKRILIILIVFAVIYFLLIGSSYFYINRYIAPTFVDFACKPVQAYPYSNAEIPESFAEYSTHGLKMNAPDCLEAEKAMSEISVYLSKDTAKCDLLIFVMQRENVSEDLEWIKGRPNLLNKWLTGRGWLTKLGMKKIGYEIPESDNDLTYLLQKMDMRDYNKFSLIETYAFTKLIVLSSIMVSPLNVYLKSECEPNRVLEKPLDVEECNYYYETDSYHYFIRQSGTDGGRYSLTLTYYPQSDSERIKDVLILGDDPELVQSIAASVRPA